MKGFKRKLVLMLFVWGLFIAGGSLVGLSGYRIYLFATFIISAVGLFGGRSIWRYIKEKKNRREE